MKRSLSNLFISLAIAGGTLGAGWAGTKVGEYISDSAPNMGSLTKEARKNNIVTGGLFGAHLGLLVVGLPVLIKDEIRAAKKRARPQHSTLSRN